MWPCRATDTWLGGNDKWCQQVIHTWDWEVFQKDHPGVSLNRWWRDCVTLMKGPRVTGGICLPDSSRPCWGLTKVSPSFLLDFHVTSIAKSTHFLTSSRPGQQALWWGGLWHSNPSGKMVAGPSVATALLKNHIDFTQSDVLKGKPGGMRKKTIKAGLCLTHFHTQIPLFVPNRIPVTVLQTPVRLLCLHGCSVMHPLEGSAECQVAGINKYGICSEGGLNGHYLQKRKRPNDRRNNRM